jgi:hypothetical protein
MLLVAFFGWIFAAHIIAVLIYIGAHLLLYLGIALRVALAFIFRNLFATIALFFRAL